MLGFRLGQRQADLFDALQRHGALGELRGLVLDEFDGFHQIEHDQHEIHEGAVRHRHETRDDENEQADREEGQHLGPRRSEDRDAHRFYVMDAVAVGALFQFRDELPPSEAVDLQFLDAADEGPQVRHHGVVFFARACEVPRGNHKRDLRGEQQHHDQNHHDQE